MSTIPSRFDVFISYAAEDRAWVEGYLLDALTAAGVRVHTEDTFALGVPRLIEFERAIQQSTRTLLVLSPAYLIDTFGQFVDVLVNSYGMETATWPVIPLLLQPANIPTRLRQLVMLDATRPETQQAMLAKLCAELQRPLPGPPVLPDCPYPGMVPFDEADSARFFGRELEVQDLLDRLRLHPFLAVIGASGSGKSSLVRAGLIAALRKSRAFGPVEWIVRIMRPGTSPLASLAQVIADLVPNVDGPAASSVGFTQLALQPHRRLLLVIDQLEELFTVATEDTVPFQQALLQLAATPGCFVVLTARADFYGDLMTLLLWNQVQAHRVEITPLSDTGLRRAIVQPADQVGVAVEAALVERLVSDAAGEPGILPLIQETLVLLWERLERRFLPLRAYDTLVLTHAAYAWADSRPRTGLQVAIARRADVAMAGLSAAQQAVARRIFLRLIQFGEGRADTRRQQPIDSLRAAGDDRALFDTTLQRLAESRLITLSGTETKDERPRSKDQRVATDNTPQSLALGRSSSVVDIAHESLIRGWPALQGWLSERRAAEQTRRRLEDKAAEWVRLGSGDGGLLDAVELAEAGRWLESPDAEEMGFDAALPALVVSSQAAIEQATYEKEEARQRELEQARALAEARARVIQRTRRFAIGLAVVALLALASAGFAVNRQQLADDERATAIAERDLAETQRRLAFAHQLAAVAIARLNNDPELSLLLATESISLTKTSEGEDALRQALTSPPVLVTLRGHTGAVNGVAFSPNGQRIVTASADRTARIWDAATGQELKQLQGHTDAINAVAFSPDDRLVATGSADKTARIWNVATGRELRRLLGNTLSVTAVAFSPDGAHIATADANSIVRVYDPATGQLIRADLFGSLLAFSPDGGQLVTGNDVPGGPYNAARWDTASGAILREYTGHTWYLAGVAFSPDSGRYILTASRDHTARIYDTATGVTLAELRGHRDAITSATFSPDEGRVATASADHTVRIWDIASWQKSVLIGYRAVYSPDSAQIASVVWGDGQIYLWDTRTGRALQVVPEDDTTGISPPFYQPDGRQFVTANDDGTVRVWDAATGQERYQLPRSEVLPDVAFSPVRDAAFSPDGQRIITADHDGAARIWDAATRQLVLELKDHGGQKGHVDWIATARFSPDGRLVVTASADGTARIWDAANGNLLHVLSGHQSVVTSAIFSSDGKRIVTSSVDGTARVWDAATGTEQRRLEGHTAQLTFAVFSPDGRTIATASVDGTARVWDAATGTEQRRLYGHTTAVLSVAYSPDGTRVITAGNDGVVRVHLVRFEDVLAQARASIHRALSCTERAQFLQDTSCPNP